MNRTLALAVVALFAVSGSADGQQAPAAPPPSGHWVGSIEAGPGISVEVDLERQGDALARHDQHSGRRERKAFRSRIWS